MDRSFDLVSLLKQQPIAKSHKIKPTQFVSVAGGVQKRLETNIKHRKTSRLSVFDKIRNISRCESPARPALSEVQQRAEHRKQQLEKWKEEKEKKKKEVAAQKKKPFVAGVTHKTTFGPPPPPKPIPRPSGRITRSQALKQRNEQIAKQPPSFAPSNASFKPPQFKNAKLPTLAPTLRIKFNKGKSNFTFEPVLPKTVQNVESARTTRSKTVSKKPSFMTETKETRQQNDTIKARSKIQPKYTFQSSSSSDMEQPTKKTSSQQSKPSHFRRTNYGQQSIKTSKLQDRTCTFQSSSSSDIEQYKVPSPIPQSELIFSSSSSSDMDQQKQKSKTLQESTSTSQESTEQEISEESISSPINTIPKSESSSEEKLRSPKAQDFPMTQEQIIEEAKNISPNVTMSRGKDNERKEMKKKRDEGLLDEDSSNAVSVNHFRRQLDSEVARITTMCDAWDKISAQTVLPEPIQELILAAVGQARLLVSQKMQQFAGLLERATRPAAPHALVTPADLHGFWDMLFMQVVDVDMRFKKLEDLRACDWTEKQTVQQPKKVVKPAAAKKPKLTGGPSRLREMIAAARKAKKDQETQSEQSDSSQSESGSVECKTFEAGFFKVSSPVRKLSISAPVTPVNKSSLLKSVLSSEARKASASKSCTSFAMLRASLLSKHGDIEGVCPLVQTPTVTPINLYATPARSILKQANLVSAKKTDKLKTVLFHDTDEPSSPLSYASCGDVPGVVEEDVKDKENNPTPKRRSRLTRQSAVDNSSPVMTRSRRKSSQTPFVVTDINVEVNKRSTRKKTNEQDTPATHKRSSTRRKSATTVGNTRFIKQRSASY